MNITMNRKSSVAVLSLRKFLYLSLIFILFFLLMSIFYYFSSVQHPFLSSFSEKKYKNLYTSSIFVTLLKQEDEEFLTKTHREFLWNVSGNSLTERSLITGLISLSLSASIDKKTYLKRFASQHEVYADSALSTFKNVENYFLSMLNRNELFSKNKTASLHSIRIYIKKLNPHISKNTKDEILHNIALNAQIYNIPYHLLAAIISTESTYKTYARSSVGALGLMQVYADVWAKELKRKKIIKKTDDLYSIKYNIASGAYIFRQYYDEALHLGHKNPLRYALHRYYGARDNTYVSTIYRHASKFAFYNKNMI
ncbi:MAG: transglycosylase SLT domain-containing protein [Desulfovibrionaceae bacterium]